MKIIGAIYVYNEKLVSIYKGDLDEVSTYKETPFRFAQYLKKEGIEDIYFVDFNASIKNEQVNFDLLKQIIDLGFKVQYGGGVRDMALIDKLFEVGVAQVVIGVSSSDLLPEAIAKYGKEKFLLGVKTKYDQLVSDKVSDKDVLDYAETTLASSPVADILFTDVLSSGVMIHPNYDMAEKIGLLSGKGVYVAGGVSELKHIVILKRNNIKGVIIAKAFYERKLSVRASLREAGE